VIRLSRISRCWSYSTEDLHKVKYKGVRPAPGYPTQPDHTEKITLFDLMKVQKNTGIELTESLAMIPGTSVCGLYFSHPESRYFAIGKITQEQIIDYAKRKSKSITEVEKCLGQNLSYESALN